MVVKVKASRENGRRAEFAIAVASERGHQYSKGNLVSSP